MLKNARGRPTCKIASKRVRFCRSRCCFAHAMDAKIDQNHWTFTIKITTKKNECRRCNGQRRTLSTDLRTCIKTRWFLSFPLLLCARHGCKNHSKSLKFYHKITTKSTNAVIAMVRNARCRSTCEHASKCVDFCRSRCCFADAMDAKFVQNRRKSSMATCNVSTVVPAARRANSKCIYIKKLFKIIAQRLYRK